MRNPSSSPSQFFSLSFSNDSSSFSIAFISPPVFYSPHIFPAIHNDRFHNAYANAHSLFSGNSSTQSNRPHNTKFESFYPRTLDTWLLNYRGSFYLLRLGSKSLGKTMKCPTLTNFVSVEICVCIKVSTF